jgi:rubrerythrin
MKISTAKTTSKTTKAPKATAAKATPVATKKETTAGKASSPSLKGSRTEANLKAAFAGESEARNKYTYFAGKAKKEGLNQIADFFLETAENEKEHAKIWFKLLYGEIGDTATNLKGAAAGENFEWTNMYAKMAKEAREEGFDTIADLFDAVGKIEKEHETRYLTLLKNIEDAQVFAKPKKVTWQCSNCGHIHKDTNAPETCPVCNHPKAYFQVLATNY